MKKILFTTEFSDHSAAVYRYALELAKAFQASIVLGIPYGKPATSTSVLSDEQKRDKSLSRLEEFAQNNTPEGFTDIPVSFDAVLDYPGEGIVKLAKNNAVDLIVMSTKGANHKGEFHFSDPALAVIRRANCPVLAVPALATFNGLKRIVFTTDFQFNDLIALNMVNRWSIKFDCQINVVHVLGRMDERHEDREKMEALQTAYQYSTNLRFKLLPSGSTKEELSDYLDENEAELLVMTTAKKSKLWQLLEGSTTQKMARSAKIPLLVVKDFDDLND